MIALSNIFNVLRGSTRYKTCLVLWVLANSDEVISLGQYTFYKGLNGHFRLLMSFHIHLLAISLGTYVQFDVNTIIQAITFHHLT